MVIKHAIPPIALEIGSAMNTPFTSNPNPGNRKVNGTTITIFRRSENVIVKNIVNGLVLGFSAFMVLGRLMAGVHWLTDIVGSIMLSMGLFCLYKSAVLIFYKSEQ